jgi:hypothetical protein
MDNLTSYFKKKRKRNIFTRWVFWIKIQVQKWEANILLKKKSQKKKIKVEAWIATSRWNFSFC